MTPGEVVRRFVAAMATRDPDEPMRYADDRIVFENVPMPLPAGSVQGRDVVRERLTAWMTPSVKVEWTIHRQIEDGPVVMHERTDEFWFPPGMFPGGDHFAMPVMAVWEVHGERIRLWSDYYDMAVIPDSLGVDLAGFGRILGQGYGGKEA
jgi:limonene-1,2-epoxide hydrolase